MSKTEEAVHNLMHSYEVTTIDAAKERWKDNDNVLHSRLCRHMVEWIADPENEVTGEADDYYRLMGAAFESSDYLSAVRIAEIGLAKYPYNVDLLAFAVRVSGKAGDFDKAEAFLQQMQKIDRMRRRYFDFYSDTPWGEPASYDQMLSSSCYGIDGTAEVILRAITKEM